MNLRKEFEAYVNTVEELEASAYDGKKNPPKALYWPVKTLTRTVALLLYPVMRCFNSPEGIIKEGKSLIEGHKTL